LPSGGDSSRRRHTSRPFFRNSIAGGLHYQHDFVETEAGLTQSLARTSCVDEEVTLHRDTLTNQTHR
jgi:hypothetical protein